MIRLFLSASETELDVKVRLINLEIGHANVSSTLAKASWWAEPGIANRIAFE
jgi:hypothetical protein